MRRGRRFVHLLCASCAATIALAAPWARAASIWMAVSDHRLDTLRGGFDLGGGLLVSFGISRAVYINGDLVTQTTLDFGRLSQLTPAQAAQLNQQMAALNLVQNGPGNTAPAGADLPNYGTVIQNTLNNQHITSQTVIHATTNAAELMKGLNLQSTLGNSLNAAIPGH